MGGTEDDTPRYYLCTYISGEERTIFPSIFNKKSLHSNFLLYLTTAISKSIFAGEGGGLIGVLGFVICANKYSDVNL